jgi:HNH endonuclease
MKKEKLKLSYIDPSLWWKRSLAINSTEWKQVRKIILERDNYQCYFCNIRASKYMIIDHINGDATNNSLENLRVLCSMCDTIRHSGLAGIKGTLEVWISNVNQLEIVQKTREFYLQKKRFPSPKEIDYYSQKTSLFPIDVATLENEEVPVEWKGYKGFFTKEFFQKFTSRFLDYII